MPGASVLEARALTIAYGSAIAVSDVSLTLEPGRIVGLAGESGSGKTTVALTLAGYPIPGARVLGGEVRLGGLELGRLDASQLRELWGSRIAYLPQDGPTALNPALRVGGQLVETIRAHRSLSRAAAQETAAELLGRVGIADPPAVLARYGHQLSGGEQQRVVIALALAGDPEVVILDEPTSGLDGHLQRRIASLVVSLTRERRTATLLISHDVRLLAETCDEVVVLRDGEIVERGPAAEAPPALRRAQASGAPVLVASGLRCTYGATVALAGASFELAAGSVLGIAGPSGSGKSTLVRAVAGLVRPDAGEIMLDERPLAPVVVDRSRADLGGIQIVFQNPDSSLNPGHTVARALERPLALHRPDVPPAERREEAGRLLARLNLSASVLNRLPRELSAGQRQRVAVARALLARPRVVLCDEATAALDVESRSRVIELLNELRDDGLAVLFVSHDLDLLGRIADDVLLLEAGAVVAPSENLAASLVP
jgi:peptide/nickel transport system ATP-binding protein